MQVKILGTGCPKCRRLEQIVRQALEETGIQAEIIDVNTIDDIMAYNILSTPGLVIGEQVKCSGRVPRKEEVTAWLREATQ